MLKESSFSPSFTAISVFDSVKGELSSIVILMGDVRFLYDSLHVTALDSPLYTSPKLNVLLSMSMEGAFGSTAEASVTDISSMLKIALNPKSFH